MCAGVLWSEGEMRTWRSVGGHTTEAVLLGYEAGVVRLKQADSREISVRIEQLSAEDRTLVLQHETPDAPGMMPKGVIGRPTGRREMVWKPLTGDEMWPIYMPEQTKAALVGLPREWEHVESEYFVIHYQKQTFARRVARMADFQYQYIASDLPGFQDRVKEKSHIVVMRDQEDWQAFLRTSNSAPEWSAAYVHGKLMYLYDIGNNEANASILAHEMSHLVLNRFFAKQPPLWLNEGLAEWYGNFGYAAFKGSKVNPKQGLGRLRDPMDVAGLTGANGYPTDREEISRFYKTSQQLVGMLMLRKEPPDFVQFLQAITVDGKPFTIPLANVYGLEDLNEMQNAFSKFLR